VGSEAGKKATMILRDGISPSSIPIGLFEEPHIVRFNRLAMESQGMVFDPEVVFSLNNSEII